MNEQPSILGLATVRRNRGITLQQISEATKIGVRSLEAIEFGDFRKLPGGIYSTSYIRQYARAIDYPEDDILEVYRRHLAGDSVSSAPGARGRKTSSGRYPARSPRRPAQHFYFFFSASRVANFATLIIARWCVPSPIFFRPTLPREIPPAVRSPPSPWREASPPSPGAWPRGASR